jgi:TolB-like protein
VNTVSRFLAELKRRKVYRAAVVYLVVGLGVLGAAELLLDPLGLSTVRPFITVLLILGFPVALVLAWAYELRPDEIGDSQRKSLPGMDHPSRPSIVVLPFSNLSPQPEDAYFSDGLTDEIITNLATVGSLRVISRSTATVLKKSQKDVTTIGRELNIDFVLEGSVRKSRDDLRVTAQLIDAHSDEHIWGEQHDGKLSDIFSVQEHIARKIVGALRLELSPAEERRLVDQPISDPEAYQLWILARYEANKFSADGIEKAINLMKRAVEIEGDNAHLYATLGYIHWAAYDFGLLYEERTLDLIEEHASRALELDPTLPEALLAKGLGRYKRGDMAGFVRHARPAVELGGDSDANALLAFVLAELGRIDEGRRRADEAVAADPLAFLPWLGRSVVDLMNCDLASAFERMRGARDRIAKGEPFPGWWVGQTAAYASHDDVALQEYEAVARTESGQWSAFCRFSALALQGEREEALRMLDGSAIAVAAETDEYYPLFLANGLMVLGEEELALDWLEKSIRWGFCNHRFLREGDRFLAPLARQPRFEALLSMAKDNQKEIGGA